jgi:parvulin-like peptidyl-prolyl isomerase
MSSNEKIKINAGNVPNDNSSMAELKRRFHSNPFVFVGTIIVLVIVIIAFVLVPAIVPSAGGLNASKLTFGYYDGAPLTYSGNNYFAHARQYYASYAQYYGWDEYEIWHRAYYSYLGRTAKLAIMKKAGYEPPQKLVNEKAVKLERFKDENGKFSRALYSQLSAADKISLLEEVKNDAILERYDADINNARTSSKEKEFIGNMAKSQRSFKVAVLPYSAYPASEIKAFIEKNSDLFTSLHFSQITLPKETEAKKVLETIRNGTSTFEDAARNQSKDEYAERGGDAGTKLAHEINTLAGGDEAHAALRTLAKGEISEPLKTADGWTFFRAEEAPKPADASDESLISQARSYITANERGMMEDYLIAKAQEAAASYSEPSEEAAAAFDETAKAAGFTVSDVGPLPVNYGDSRLFSTLSSFGVDAFQAKSGDSKTSASFDSNFWKKAYKTPLFTASKPLVLDGRQTYVALIFPKEENGNDTNAKSNTESMFTGSWIENAIVQDTEDTVLSSSKFEDNFDDTFKYLYPEQFYQHSFSGLNF